MTATLSNRNSPPAYRTRGRRHVSNPVQIASISLAIAYNMNKPLPYDTDCLWSGEQWSSAIYFQVYTPRLTWPSRNQGLSPAETGS